MKLKLAFTLVASSICFAQPTTDNILNFVSPQSFRETHAYARKIIENCPPKKCVLLSLGMTNTLLDSFLRYYIEKDSLGDSYLKYAPFKGLAQLEYQKPETIDRFFREFLPSDKEIGAKKLMVLRTLHMGVSVEFGIFPALQGYIERNQPPWKLGGFLSIGQIHFRLERKIIQRKWPEWDLRFRKIDERDEIRGSYRRIDQLYYRYKMIDIDHYRPFPRLAAYKNNPRYLELDRLTALYIEDRPSFLKLAPKELLSLECRDWLFR